MAELGKTDPPDLSRATSDLASRRKNRGDSAVRWAGSFVAIFVLAIGLRCVHVATTWDMPFVRHLIGDAAGYFSWAQQIAQGKWLGTEPFYQAPLYPYALAVVLALLGPQVWAIRLVQAAAGAVAAVCLCYGTGRAFGRRAGILAGFMLACYAPAIFFDGIVQKASLGCFLSCCLLALLLSSDRRISNAKCVAIGVFLGLVILTRENALVWLPIVAGWTWVRGGGANGRSRVKSLLAFVCGIMFVLGLVGSRNKIVGDEWSISTFQAGPNFYIGNHRGADGRYQPLVRGHETPAFERADATKLAEQDLGRELSASEVSHYWMSRAMGDIRADPSWWTGLMARKMLMVWNRYEVSDAESLYVYKGYSPVLGILAPVWHFGVLCPLAAAGILCTWREWRRLWVYWALIASMAGAVALFYVMARYRFPLVPFLIPFAAVGTVAMWDYVRSRQWRGVVAPGVVAVAVAIVVNWPVHDEKRLNALAVMNVGVALAEEGDLAGATVKFRGAVGAYPESAEANGNLAQALALQGEFAAAIPYYQAALRAEPTLTGVDFNLGVALERVERPEEALTHYERALELDPGDAEAGAAVGRLRQTRP